MNKLLYQDLTYKIIGCAIEVHNYLGPGFLESVYEEAFCYELAKATTLYFERQVFLDVKYKDVIFEKRFKADILVNQVVIVELKAQKCLTAIDEAQLINYLKVTELRVGLLFNFGSAKLEQLRRVV